MRYFVAHPAHPGGPHLRVAKARPCTLDAVHRGRQRERDKRKKKRRPRHLTSVRKNFSWTAAQGRDKHGQLIVSEFVPWTASCRARDRKKTTEGGFKHGGWQAPLHEEESLSLITRDIGNGRLLLVARLRNIFRVLAQSTTERSGQTHNAPKFVASRKPRNRNGTIPPLSRDSRSGRIKQKTTNPRDGKRQLVQTCCARPGRSVQPMGLPALFGTGKDSSVKGQCRGLAPLSGVPKGAIHFGVRARRKPK